MDCKLHFSGACTAALILLSAPAFARQGDVPLSVSAGLAFPASVVTLSMSDPAKLLQRDAQKRASRPGPLRVAEALPVTLQPGADGDWSRLPDGRALWRMGIRVPRATDLNFGFSKFRLPEGAALYLIGAGGYFEGPYTATDNRADGQFWSPMVPGEQAVIELYLPRRDAPHELHLSQVAAGYRDWFKRDPSHPVHSGSKAGNCNIDAVCPLGDAWRDEIRSVTQLLIGGTGACTGTLVMDAASSFRPFVLTANHCEITTALAGSIVAHWNFQAPTCGQRSGGSRSQNTNGATLRAARLDVDMALLELNSRPDPSFNVYYAGWDRSTNAPQSSFGIHHPEGDEKSLALDQNPAVSTGSCIGTSAGSSGTHWDVLNWEQGITEPGSSGSALWDFNSHRVVGFLSGGDSSCTNRTGSDCYGKFTVAWDGASSSQRLRDWLDPGNTNAMTTSGSNPNGTGGTGGSAGSGGSGGATGTGGATGNGGTGGVPTQFVTDSGGGCTLNPRASADWSLLLLSLLALIGITRRRAR